ncbi:MAG: hypothetical protein CMO44_17430, partial [Verrucomicrobiales bacterium]|nr:hypothetical protein [Verrucomicrobiales bacterium]
MSVAVQVQLECEVPGPLDSRAQGTVAGRSSIATLALYPGLLRYETDTGQFVVWDGTNWVALASMV